MKRVSKALDENFLKTGIFFTLALAQRPAIHVQHFQASRQKGNSIKNRMKALPSS